MIINEQNKTIDMEARDINYILPAYLRIYQFHSKNELPTKIIFPMFVSVKAANGVEIPIEYVPPLDAIAMEITKDGSNVAEVTEEQEAVLDEKDRKIEDLKKQVESLSQTGGGEVLGGTPLPDSEGNKVGGTETHEEETVKLPQVVGKGGEANDKPPKPESPAKAAFKVDSDPKHQPKPDREIKQPPGGDIGAGQPLSGMQPRSRDDQKRIARDLIEEPSIEGKPEKPFDKEIKRDEKGKPIIEDKPSATD